MPRIIWLLIVATLPFFNNQAFALSAKLPETRNDSIAEKMLLFQRNNGGWTQYGGDPADYRKPVSEAQKLILKQDKNKLDATMDDKSTTGEIKYLLKAYAETKNQEYLKAAEKGIAYLLSAQNKKGGWPQSFPDTSGYHKHITYNDHAMIDGLTVLKSTAEKAKDYEVVNPKLAAQAKIAVDKGVACILKTQVTQNGKLTAWGAQHDNKTLLPAPARKFEPASLSSSESVGVINFLMSLDNPTPEIKKSVAAAVAWLESVKIHDIELKRIQDPNQKSGRDNVVAAKPGAIIWARFYELETNKPIFIGRDAIIKYNLAEIENERRVGYGWYNDSPEKVIAGSFPKWKQKWSL